MAEHTDLDTLAKIIDDFNAGTIPDQEGVIQAIMKALNLTRDQVLAIDGPLGQIAPLLTRTVADVPPTEAEAPVTTTPAVAEAPTGAPAPAGVSPPNIADVVNDVRARGTSNLFPTDAADLRQREFDIQSPRAAGLRVIGETFGELTPFGRGAAQNAFARFQATDPITGFAGAVAGTAPELGNRFSAFLGGPRPTREGLTEQLNALLQSAGTGTGRELFETRFGDPQAAAAAAVSPFLQGLPPRQRAGVGRTIVNRFERQLAQSPENFQEGDTRAIFEAFRKAGFLQ